MAGKSAAQNIREAANGVAQELRRLRDLAADREDRVGFDDGLKMAYKHAVHLLEEAGVVDLDPEMQRARDEGDRARFAAHLALAHGLDPERLRQFDLDRLRVLHDMLDLGDHDPNGLD